MKLMFSIIRDTIGRILLTIVYWHPDYADKNLKASTPSQVMFSEWFVIEDLKHT